MGSFEAGLMQSLQAASLNDIAPEVAQLRADLPHGVPLVSFGPVAHRFAYYYGQPIRELAWPAEMAQLPSDVEYFCYEQHAGDSAQVRASGRGRTWSSTSGTLPFRWEQVAWIPCDPHNRQRPIISVVVGRVVSRCPIHPGRLAALDGCQARRAALGTLIHRRRLNPRRLARLRSA